MELKIYINGNHANNNIQHVALMSMYKNSMFSDKKKYLLIKYIHLLDRGNQKNNSE